MGTLLERGLYDGGPPALQTRLEMNPTLLFSWWCTAFALAIILTRCCGRMVRNNQMFREDKIMLYSTIPLLIRMALVHVVLIWGTNNVDTSGGLTAQEIHQREIGSKLVLASRIFYAMFIWTAKFTVSEFLKRLTASYWKRSYERSLHFIRVFLAVTFAAVIIATLAECQPFSHYWQVIPDPGPQCRQGYPQLLTMGIADIITDTLLVIFPISILIHSAMPVMRRLRLGLLFSLNAILICVTTFRILAVIKHHGRQQTRTVFASGEILAAAAVSNAVILGSFLRDRGPKKAKYRTSQTESIVEGPSSRRMTLTQQAYGSDLDLFNGMCYRTSHEDTEMGLPRAPPIMSGANNEEPVGPNEESSTRADDGWRRPSDNSSYQKAVRRGSRSRSRADSIAGALPETGKLSKTVTFSDPGGLLDNASSQASTVVTPSPSFGQSSAAQDFAGPVSGRRWSRGRQASIAEGSSQPESRSMESRPRTGSVSVLKDVGGLLG